MSIDERWKEPDKEPQSMLMQQGREAFMLSIDDDLMQAGIIVRDPDKTTKQDIVAALKERKIIITERDEDRIGRVIRLLRRTQFSSEPMTVVKGTPPQDGKDGRIVDLVEMQARERDEHGNVNHYESNVLRIVNSGDKLLEVIPPTQHKDGVDILGNPVPAYVGAYRKVSLGKNVELDDDNRFVIATTGGRFVYEAGTALVDPDLTIDRDVSFRTGNINFEKDVIINKDVFGGFEVRTQERVFIRGTIEGARIEANGDVFVSRGILAKGKGIVMSRGTVACRFAKNAVIRAMRDLLIAQYCYDSDIRCDGRLIMPEGVLIGGIAHARMGAVVSVLGNTAGSRTIMHVDWAKPSRMNDLQETEVLEGASGGQPDEECEPPPSIEVRTQVFAGTIIRFGDVAAKVQQDMTGNLSIYPLRGEDGSTCIVIHNKDNGVKEALSTVSATKEAV